MKYEYYLMGCLSIIIHFLHTAVISIVLMKWLIIKKKQIMNLYIVYSSFPIIQTSEIFFFSQGYISFIQK